MVRGKSSSTETLEKRMLVKDRKDLKDGKWLPVLHGEWLRSPYEREASEWNV